MIYLQLRYVALGFTHVSADAILARCGRPHFHADDLGLEIGNISAKPILVVISSHKGAAHHHRQIQGHLRKVGKLPKVFVKYGCRFGEVFQCGKQIRGNEIATFSWRCLLLPYISTLLGKHKIATVRNLENSAFHKVFLFRRDVLEEIVSANKSVC